MLEPVSDGLLLTVAQIAATLIGLLLVAVAFYIETGLRRLAHLPEAGPFLRATTKLILALYGLVLAVSLALLTVHPAAVTGLFIAVAVLIVVTMVERGGLPEQAGCSSPSTCRHSSGRPAPATRRVAR